MTRIVLPFFLLVHVLPFLLSGADWTVTSALAVAVIALSFTAGLVLGRSGSGHPDAAHRWRLLVPPPSALAIAAVCYFALRAADIVPLAAAIRQGQFAEYAMSLAVARYDTGGKVSVQANAGTIAFFVFLGMAGARASVGSWHPTARWATALAVLAAIFVESASLARAGVLLGLALLSAIYLFNRRRAASVLPVRKIAVGFAAAIAVAAAIFLFSAYFRLSTSDDVEDILTSRASSYLLGSHEAFLRWVSAGTDDGQPFGFYTWTSFFKAAGAEVQQGMFSPVQTSFGDTNVFLIYRGIFADFGLAGGGLFVALLGYFIGRAGRPSVGSPSICLGISALCMILFPLVSPYSFSTFTVALVVLLASFLATRSARAQATAGFPAGAQ